LERHLVVFLPTGEILNVLGLLVSQMFNAKLRWRHDQ
jgi:hypothetical protein